MFAFKYGRASSPWVLMFQKLAMTIFAQVSDLGVETILGHTTDGVTDTSKHNITDRFKFHIKNVQIADEGKYRCKLTVSAQSSQFDTYLVVSGE